MSKRKKRDQKPILSTTIRFNIITNIINEFPEFDVLMLRKFEIELCHRYRENYAMYIDRLQDLVERMLHNESVDDFFTTAVYLPQRSTTAVASTNQSDEVVFLKCYNCGAINNDIVTNAEQRRSADEGMTIVCVCKICKNRWVK